MSYLDIIELFINDYTFRTICLGTIMMGIICGMLGSYSVLRKQGLLGDAISHASLPGIIIAYLITGSKEPWVLFAGAITSGLIGNFWITGIISRTHLKSDTALGIVLSVFFGFGMLLLTFLQKRPDASQAGLEKFLFGQSATLLTNDVISMMVTGVFSIVLVMIFWKEFKIISFDPQYAKTLGIRVKIFDLSLTTLIVIAIVTGLQTIGVVLMSAMLLAPAAAARQWTNKLASMIVLASFFGAFSGLVGTIISSSASKLSTGPVIVLVAIFFVLISFFFAPERGLVWRQFRYYKSRKNLRLNKTLTLMYEIAQTHDNIHHPHSINLLNDFLGYQKQCLKELVNQNLIEIDGLKWNLTPKGFEQAKHMYINNSEKT